MGGGNQGASVKRVQAVLMEASSVEAISVQAVSMMVLGLSVMTHPAKVSAM
jgi:hypothetical protein